MLEHDSVIDSETEINYYAYQLDRAREEINTLRLALRGELPVKLQQHLLWRGIESMCHDCIGRGIKIHSNQHQPCPTCGGSGDLQRTWK